MSVDLEFETPCVTRPRVILPVAQWPALDSALWNDAWHGSGPDGRDNVATRWSSRRRKIVEDAYGRYLGCVLKLDPAYMDVHPALRPTPDVVMAFIYAMRAAGLAPVSVAMQVGALSRMMQALCPSGDWSWLRRRYWRLKCRAKPSRDKRTRVVPSADLYALGIHLMETASDGARRTRPFFAASQYRDGLMIALLAARPLRIGNFQHLELLRSLVYRGGRYWLVFDDTETKTGRPIDVYVPDHLTPYLETYLKLYRKVLLDRRPPGTSVATALWISKSGQKMQEAAIRAQIESRTKDEFGHPINPHLFRDCLATSFAVEDPEHVRCISDVLGHATLATAEKHYNQATMVTAARRFSATMLEIRYKFIEIMNDSVTRDFLASIDAVCGSSDADAPDEASRSPR